MKTYMWHCKEGKGKIVYMRTGKEPAVNRKFQGYAPISRKEMAGLIKAYRRFKAPCDRLIRILND